MATQGECLPPLPPRPSAHQQVGHDRRRRRPSTRPQPHNPADRSRLPPPITASRSNVVVHRWRFFGRRDTSTHVVVPVKSTARKRDLLLIFIHGFLGDETTFQSFPEHLHNILSVSLRKSHVVQTKIYPRYKSRKAIEVARDEFSNWLMPHENLNRDIILISHSMGGILAAEVALLPKYPMATEPKHRLMGTLNFDVPFLGLQPGVIVSGMSNLLRLALPKPTTISNLAQVASSASAMGPLLGSATNQWKLTSPVNSRERTKTATSLSTLVFDPRPFPDPNYDPTFSNDIHIPTRKGIDGGLHFFNKHHKDLGFATKQYFMSHIEFGGCLTDCEALSRRYHCLRQLEGLSNGRVRFVNYYTASTGYATIRTAVKAPLKYLGEVGDATVLRWVTRELTLPPCPLAHIAGRDPAPPSCYPASRPKLSLVPPRPRTHIQSRKQHQKLTGTCNQLLVEDTSKLKRNLQVSTMAKLRAGETKLGPLDKKPFGDEWETVKSKRHDEEKKEKTFCIVPAGDGAYGKDRCWVKVRMEGIDEVGAHCGLFFVDSGAAARQLAVGPDSGNATAGWNGSPQREGRADGRYGRLLRDVSSRIEDWVQEAEGKRMAANRYR